MILVAGYTLGDPHRRNEAVAAHQAMVARARGFDGCLDLAIGADALDPRRINIFERWRDRAALDAWRKVADPPGAPFDEAHVHLYRSDKQEAPF